MTTTRSKPQGESGPISIGPDGVEWVRNVLPDDKVQRELKVAELFVSAFSMNVYTQSEPSLAPFESLTQNAQDDLDFTVTTSQGEMLMELAEFAPLDQLGPTFADLRTSPDFKVKSDLALELIGRKSAHQGGLGRFLVIYTTEDRFGLDYITVERMRRKLANSPPAFDRVYYVDPDLVTAPIVREIWPGAPWGTFADMDDEKFESLNWRSIHPTEFIESRTVSTPLVAQSGDSSGAANYSITYQWPIRVRKRQSSLE